MAWRIGRTLTFRPSSEARICVGLGVTSVSNRLRDIGIQRRIMTYVAVGLVTVFAITAFLGLRAIQQATELVFAERLGTARTAAGILEGEFRHLADDVREASESIVSAPSPQMLTEATSRLFTHIATTDSFAFQSVTGLWVLTEEGEMPAEIGRPEASPMILSGFTSHLAEGFAREEFLVVPAVGQVAGSISFATLATIVSSLGQGKGLVVAVHTVSKNSDLPYVPGSYPPAIGSELKRGEESGVRLPQYHLEVVDARGVTVVGIGPDERPGEPSTHFLVIRNLIAGRAVGAMLHKPSKGEDFEPHVLAVVPVPGSPFHLVLEQPADEALLLPTQLRRQLFGFMGIAFVVIMGVAWITTRQVVRPTEQLTAAAQRMARGDLESPIDVFGQDEVGRLAETLETMRRQLRDARREIQSANRELESRVKERTARLSEVVGKVISAQEEERQRLARELHDGTAQTLGALSIALDRARDRLGDSTPAVAAQIAEARGISFHLLQEIDRLILDLRPQMLDDLGLAAAVRWYAETHLQGNGVKVDLDVSEPRQRLSPHVEVAIFRVAQEAMNNILRHAGAASASIRLKFEDSQATLVASDDGRGFDVDRVLGSGAPVLRVGLIGMRERVALLNGEMQVRSQEGHGTEISIRIPLGKAP